MWQAVARNHKSFITFLISGNWNLFFYDGLLYFNHFKYYSLNLETKHFIKLKRTNLETWQGEWAKWQVLLKSPPSYPLILSFPILSQHSICLWERWELPTITNNSKLTSWSSPCPIRECLALTDINTRPSTKVTLVVVATTTVVVGFQTGHSGMKYAYLRWSKLNQCKYAIKTITCIQL